MRVEILTQKDFIKVKPETLIKGIRSKLLSKHACVVFDKEKYLGVLSFKDLVLNPFEHVVDCMSDKPAINTENEIASALHTMIEYSFEVLPVFKNDKFLGLLFKNDIVEYLNELNRELEIKVREKTAELEKATKLAEENEKLKSAFLANLSHEIRTPLNSIMGFSEFLLQEDISKDKIIEYSQIINKSCERLFLIIDDVLLMSKLETGQLAFNPREINLNSFLNDILSFYKPLVKTKQLEIDITRELADTEANILIDDLRLRQIIDNLLNNSLKFTQQGKITFGYSVLDGFISFYVKDTGSGIKSEYHERIFERFQQAETDYKNNAKGVGLGLSIVKSLVELMGGKINLKSYPEKGTEFIFTIPHTPVYAHEMVEKPIFNKLKDRNFSILLVDDEPVNLLLLETLIGKLSDYKLYKANNGKTAVELCQQNNDILLVFMDINMPIMNGIEATKRIKNERPEIILIAQSAYTSEKDRKAARKAGCTKFIAKPINKEVLSDIIQGIAN